MKKKKIVIGVTGASGAIYAHLLLSRLSELTSQIEECGVVFSDNAKKVWEFELPDKKIADIPFKIYESTNFFAPFASGSAQYDLMIVCPCTMGTLGRIAHGVSNDLITRTADVILKERRKLILVTREMPMGLIHINNMKIVTQAGGIICPASPSFYSKSTTMDQLLNTVIDKILQLADFEIKAYQWGK